MNKKITAAACVLLHGVLTLCMEISATTKADCFFSYSPHVNSYMVYVHRDGWTEDAEMEWVDVNSDITCDNLEATLKKLAEIYCELEGLKNV